MNNDKAIVAVSLIWVGIMAALSRSWIGDLQQYVRTATGHGAPTAAPAAPPATHTQPGDANPRSVPDGCLGQPGDYWCGLDHYVNGHITTVLAT